MANLVPGMRTRLRDEGDVGMFLIGFGVWYLANLRGALSIDEAIYAESGVGLLTGDPYRNPTHALAPAAKYATGISQIALGQTSFAARLPAVLFALGTLYATYRLGRRFRGRWLGLTAAILLGSTYLFARYSVRMMLDVPLAFFFTMSLFAVVAYRDHASRPLGIATGALLVGVATVKIYGLLYALPLVGFLGLSARRRPGGRIDLRFLRPPLLGGVALGTLLYVPFVVFPHPPTAGSYGAAVEAVLALPILGNFAYISGQALAKNVLHLGGGHAITVGGVVYQRPPWWTYWYWFYQFGGYLYVGSLAAFALALPMARRPPDRHLRTLAWVIVVPLVALSALTVKFPRYVLPLYPVVLLAGGSSLLLLLSTARERLRPFLGLGRPTAVPLVVASLLVLSLATPAPLMQTATSSIREDSGFDHVADVVDSYAQDSDGTDVVLTYHPSALTYYLPDEADVVVLNIRPGDVAGRTHAEHLARIDAGEIDLVVMPTDEPRLAGTALYRRVREDGRPLLAVRTSPEGMELVVYELPKVG